MVRNWLSAALVAATVVALAGCRHRNCRRNDDTRRPLGDPDALGAPIPPRVAPLESIPPTGIPPTPGTGRFEPADPIRRNYLEPDPPRAANYPPSYLQRELPGPAPGVLGEPIASAEKLAPLLPPVEMPQAPKLLVPVPLPNEVPDRKEPLLLPPPPDDARKDLPPPLADKPRDKAPLDLPEFATVLDRGPVTTSRRPELDGFAWLKANGYKTVAYLHDPAAKDVASARELAEKKGLTFVAIPVSPDTLPAAYKTFAALVRDAANRPLHVFAASGNRSGSLWYLMFRDVELLPDDAARVRAGKLGLQGPADSAEAKGFWLAVQEFLSKR